MANGPRSAVAEDLDDINLLFQSVMRAGSTFSTRQEFTFKRIVEEDIVDLLVIEQDQYVVACCHCAIVPTLAHGGRSYAVLNHFIVDPLNRQQGHAKALLEYAIAHTKARGCYQVYLVLEQAGLWQEQFLARYGFKAGNGVYTLG